METRVLLILLIAVLGIALLITFIVLYALQKPPFTPSLENDAPASQNV